MGRQSLRTSETPTIHVIASGDLHVTGWEQSEIQTEGNLNVEQQGDSVRIQSGDDATLFVPARAILVVENVGGDASLQKLDGEVEVKHVGGDFRLSQSGAISATRVGGDLEASQLHGILKVSHVGGDLRAKDMQGVCLVSTVGGNLEMENAAPGLQATIGGDAHLSLAPQAQQEYSLRAGGDILCHLDPAADAVVEVRSGGGDIFLRLPDRQEHVEARNYHFTLGSGGAKISLMAGGDVILTGEKFDQVHTGSFSTPSAGGLSGLGDRISSQVEESLRAAGVATSVSRRTEETLRRAEERAARAVKRAEEHIDRVAGQWGAPGQPAPEPSQAEAAPQASSASAEELAPAHEPVSEDERLSVLRMLQNKKITVEEAEQLLEALDAQDEE